MSNREWIKENVLRHNEFHYITKYAMMKSAGKWKEPTWKTNMECSFSHAETNFIYSAYLPTHKPTETDWIDFRKGKTLWEKILPEKWRDCWKTLIWRGAGEDWGWKVEIRNGDRHLKTHKDTRLSPITARHYIKTSNRQVIKFSSASLQDLKYIIKNYKSK